MKNKLLTIIVLLLVAVAAYYIYDTFRTRTYEEKIASIIHLEDSRQFNQKLKSYLEDPDPRVRARAALSIGRIGAKGAGETLYQLITSDVDDVAVQAAFSIGLTDEKSYASKLLDIAFDAPSRVGEMAVASAGRLADKSMTDVHQVLTTYLTHPSPEVRKQACMALFRSSAVNEAPALIDFIQTEPDEDVKVAALYALARLKIKEAYNTYVDFLSDADPFVRTLSLQGIGLSDNKGAIHYLSIALNDADKNVVAQAVKLLAKKKTQAAMEKLVAKLSKEDDEKLVVDLIDGLMQQNNPNAVDEVKDILDRATSPNIIGASIKYLAATEKDRAVIKIDSLMRDANPRIRAAAAEAFGIINSPNNIPRLSVLFSDPNVLVRATAFDQLIKIDSTNLKFYLDQALADSNFIMPSLAIDEISTRTLVPYLPKLHDLSMNSQKLKIDVRRSLVDCAGSFLKKNPTDSNALRILVNMSLDRNYIVRKEAIQVYKDVLDEDRSNMLRAVNTRISESKIESALKKYKTNPYATITTNKGSFEFVLFFDVAPLTVLNFIDLADDGFYENVIFHRVISDFVAQGGDPTGTGWGGPGYLIRCEYSPEPYIRGTVGIATSGKDTGGSQFFIALAPLPHLDARYTVFGQVLSGMDVVDQLVIGDTIKEITINEGTAL